MVPLVNMLCAEGSHVNSCGAVGQEWMGVNSILASLDGSSKGTSLWHQKAAMSVNSALHPSPWFSLEDRKMNRSGFTKFNAVGI